jgi:hypothetical protein
LCDLEKGEEMATATVGRPAARERTGVRLTGWSVFASTVLIVVGGFNLINGFTALQHANYYTTHIVYSNLTFWGWMFLIWGGLQVVAGAMVAFRNIAGTYLGVFLAGTAAILWFFMIFAAPWPALLGVGTSLLVLYALTAGSLDETY